MPTLREVKFIYCPKSGSRVIARNPCDEIIIVHYENGCDHVLGGKHFSFAAATPGKWCRADAGRLVNDIIGKTGGIAWDDQGQMSLVIPERAARGAVELLQAALPEAAFNLPSLWREGLAELNARGGLERTRPIFERTVFDGAMRPIVVAEIPATETEHARYIAGYWGCSPESEALDLGTLQSKGWGWQFEGGVRGAVFDGNTPGFPGLTQEEIGPYLPTTANRVLLPLCKAAVNAPFSSHDDEERVCPQPRGHGGCSVEEDGAGCPFVRYVQNHLDHQAVIRRPGT